MATVKVSEKTYKRLNELAGKLRSRLGRPVSVDETLDYLMKEKKVKPSDFEGAWSMTDEEEREVLRSIEVLSGRWKLRRESS